MSDYECPKHPNSRRELEQRRADRLAGKLNPPIRGVRGLANLVAAEAGRGAHKVACECRECVPDWLREEMKHWPKVTKGMYEARPRAAVLVTIIPSTPAPARTRRKWTEKRGTSSN